MVLVQKQTHRCQYLYQNSMILAQKQNIELRNKPMLIRYNYDKGGIYNRENKIK